MISATALVRRKQRFVEMVGSPSHLAYMTGMVVLDRQDAEKYGVEPTFPPDWSAKDVCEDMSFTAKVSENWTLTDEMFEVISHAVKSMPPQSFLPYDLPSPQGYLRLPKPLVEIDARGEPLAVDTIMWSSRTVGQSEGTQTPGVVVWLFGDAERVPGEIRARISGSEEFIDKQVANFLEMQDDLPPDSLISTLSPAFGQAFWGQSETQKEHYRLDEKEGLVFDPVEPLDVEFENINGQHTSRIHADEVVKDGTEDGIWKIRQNDRIVTVQPEPYLQWLACYFHFVKSELTSAIVEPIDRAQRRRMARLEMPVNPVTVIALRRRSGERHDHEEGSWSLTYRYIRRAHWRNQWYPSIQDHRWIYILPTVVGPEDGPLRVRDTVNSLLR